MMRTHRGIVCEITNEYMVFLTDRGEFLRGLPISGTPGIGVEAEFHPIPLRKSPRRKMGRFVGAALVAALFFMFIAASLISPQEEVMAYVQLEANTSLELGVDKEGRVVSLRYLNDPPQLPEEWDDSSLSISEALEHVGKRMSSDLNAEILVTTILMNTRHGQQTDEIIKNAVREMKSSYKNLNWEVANSSIEERELANQKQMSIQRFKKSEQAPPLLDKKPSTEIKPSPNEESVKRKNESNPGKETNHGKGNTQKPQERIEPKSEKPEKKQIPERPEQNLPPRQNETKKPTPEPKQKPMTPASEHHSTGKGNANPSNNRNGKPESNKKPNTPAADKNEGNRDNR